MVPGEGAFLSTSPTTGGKDDNSGSNEANIEVSLLLHF